MCHSDEMCAKVNALGYIIILDTLSRSANNIFDIRRYYIRLQTSVIVYLNNKILQRWKDSIKISRNAKIMWRMYIGCPYYAWVESRFVLAVLAVRIYSAWHCALFQLHRNTPRALRMLYQANALGNVSQKWNMR